VELRLIRLPEVKHLTGLPRSTIYRLMHLGSFPHPVKLAERAIAWKSGDIEIWMEGLRPSNPKGELPTA
jgi:prophage regulatory protein